MRIAILGKGHLAETHARAYKIKGFDVFTPKAGHMISGLYSTDLIFVCPDVMDHGKLDEVDEVMETVLGPRDNPVELRVEVIAPVILVSQVPPGYTRKWASNRRDLYYQVDTIIMQNALNRVLEPEQLIIGGRDKDALTLPLAYQEYLRSFDVRAALMDYETAELAKCAINCALAAQVELAQIMNAAAEACGADYPGVRHVLHRDSRIGKHAYLYPGEINQHLKRDMDTVKKLIAKGAVGGSAS